MRWTLLPLLVLLGISATFGQIGHGVNTKREAVGSGVLLTEGIGEGVAPEVQDQPALGHGVSLDSGIGHGVRVARQIGAGVGFGGHGGIGGGAQPGWGGARSPIGSGVQPAQPPMWGNNGGIGSGVQPARPLGPVGGNNWSNGEKAKTLPTDEPTLSRKKRYSGYEIDCRLFYDKTICFRIYDDNLCNVPRDVTCWKIQPRGWNCTETENVNYLNRHMTGCSQQYGNHQMFDLSSRQSDCNIDAWGEQSCRYTIPNNPFDDWFAQQRQYADRMSRAHSRGQVPDFGYGCGYRAGDGPIHADKPDIYRGAQGNTITVHRETTIVQNNGQGGHLNNGRHQETAEHGTMSYYGSDRTNNNQDGDYRRRQGDGPLRAERPDMHRGNQKQSRAQYWETRVTTEYRDDCHPNHGRDICFRVYETRDCEIPRDMTCWNIGTHQLNCTTIDNVRFLHKRSAYYGSRRSEQLCSDDQWGGRLCVSNPVGNYGREYDRRPVYHEQYGQARQREYGNQRLGDGRIHADRTDPYQGQRGSGYHRGNSFDSRSSSHSSTSSSSYQFHSSSSSHGGSYQQAQRGTSYGYGQRASDGRIYADRTDPYRGQQAGCGSYC